MKKLFTATCLAVMAVLFAVPAHLMAQSGTLVVYASGPTLDQAIGADTTSGGLQKHSEYQLVSLDTTYIFDKAVTVKSNISIVGVPDPSTGRLPCIQPDVLEDGTIPSTLFSFVGKNINVNIRNLYLLGLSINGSPAPGTSGIAIQVSSDNVRVAVDNVVFEEWLAFAIGYNGNWDDFFITNCKFRNMVDPTQWYEGEVLRNEYPGTAYTDSVVMKYNTFFCVNAYSAAPVTKYYETYFEFSHNDVIFSFKNPFFIFNVTDAKINNNIFYGLYAGGANFTETPWWDNLWYGDKDISVISFEPLGGTVDSVFGYYADSLTNPVMDSIAETHRTVEVKNNLYFWPKAITDFWTAWNDTATFNASGDSIVTPVWMNSRTTGMFADKTHWPGFVESGNQNVDPSFGASIDSVIGTVGNTTAGPFGIGLLAYIRQIRTGTAAHDIWGYHLTEVDTTGAIWVPAWPLPESSDLKYSASMTAPDGLPYGDPYWFSGVTGVKTLPSPVPAKFDLSNNYPNPFNPSTRIKVSLTRGGLVSLTVYNVLGQVVRVLESGYKPAGEYIYNVNMDGFSSGVYFYTLKQGTNSITKKMLLLK